MCIRDSIITFPYKEGDELESDLYISLDRVKENAHDFMVTFDNDAIFGVYRGNNNNWTYVTQVDQQNVKNVSTIPIITPNPCLVASTNIRVERGEYAFDIALNLSLIHI